MKGLRWFLIGCTSVVFLRFLYGFSRVNYEVGAGSAFGRTGDYNYSGYIGLIAAGTMGMLPLFWAASVIIGLRFAFGASFKVFILRILAVLVPGSLVGAFGQWVTFGKPDYWVVFIVLLVAQLFVAVLIALLLKGTVVIWNRLRTDG